MEKNSTCTDNICVSLVFLALIENRDIKPYVRGIYRAVNQQLACSHFVMCPGSVKLTTALFLITEEDDEEENEDIEAGVLGLNSVVS